MISYLSAVIAASPVGRSYAKVRNDPIVHRLVNSPFFEWLIPSTLVAVIVVAFAWIIFGPK